MIVCAAVIVDLVAAPPGADHGRDGGARLPYVKTSLRGQQRAVREEVRALA